MESTSDKCQFDSRLGGDVEIPESVSLKQFVRARMDEIEALTQLIETPSNNIFLKHQFPKHMRRRAMSQNLKRIPKRLRDHQIDMREKSGIREVPLKRPRRKYRRRPQNLLEEYNRRQRKFIWLETHIWHAKRFKMIEKWGYKLPHFPNDKSYRACYRASSKYCLIQDISYFCCIEISGQSKELLDGLEQHTSCECGLTFNAKHIQTGSREGRLMFYCSGKYPYGAIGEVNYIWQPSDRQEPSENRTLWLWCHPSFYSEVLDQLVMTFSLEIGEAQTIEGASLGEPMEVEDSSEPKNVEALKLSMRNVPFIRAPKYRSSVNTIKVVLLKDTLNRFRLTGPLSQAVLTSTFRAIDMKKRTTKDWAAEYYRERQEICQEQLKLWEMMKNVTDPGQLPPHCVVGLIALDPRFTMPAHRTKPSDPITGAIVRCSHPGAAFWMFQLGGALLYTAYSFELSLSELVAPRGVLYALAQCVCNQLLSSCCPVFLAIEDYEAQKMESISQATSSSPIWSFKIRDEVTSKKLSTHQINELRSNKLVPGMEIESYNEDINDFPAIPCLFLQRPGTNMDGKPLGYSGGWDVIVPAGFGQPVWLGLVMHGGRAGGLKEMATISREAGKLCILPDTTSGKMEEEARKNEEQRKYFRLPPAKRPNYIKLGFQTPFHCPWNILIKDWTSKKSQEFFVHRNRSKLLCLRDILAKEIENIFMEEDSESSALVPVMVTLKGKGNIANNASICIPAPVDFENLKNDPKYSGPVEKKHTDDLSDKRKELLQNHHKELKKLARVRHKERLRGSEVTAISSGTVVKHSEIMKQMWLPECESIKDCTSRTIMGFVTDGDFSFTSAKSVGVGYVSMVALVEFFRLLDQNKLKYVLVRNRNTMQYRFAAINLVVS